MITKTVLAAALLTGGMVYHSPAEAFVIGPSACPAGFHLVIHTIRGPRYVAAIRTCVRG